MKRFTLLLFVVSVLFVVGCTKQQNTTDTKGVATDYVKKLDNAVDKAKDIAKKTYTTNYSGQSLNSFPNEILSQTSLKVLNLSNNNINSLPAEIGQLTNLEELYLDDNNLTGALPAEIRKMTKLKILSASNNGLTGIPAEIGHMKNIKTINFSNNGIDTYPNEIENIKNNLEILDLSGNTFSSATISEIKNKLPNTKVID